MKIPGPDHPITITPSKEHVRVTFNGKVVADTRRALVLQEAAYKPVFYIPREDAQTALFERTTNSTHCPPGKHTFGTQYAAVVRALQHVVLLPQKFAPAS